MISHGLLFLVSRGVKCWVAVVSRTLTIHISILSSAKQSAKNSPWHAKALKKARIKICSNVPLGSHHTNLHIQS